MTTVPDKMLSVEWSLLLVVSEVADTQREKGMLGFLVVEVSDKKKCVHSMTDIRPEQEAAKKTLKTTPCSLLLLSHS